MGEPMALNLARSGVPLVVWNRSGEKCVPLQAAGAAIARTSDEVFARADVVMLMLANEAAIDAVLCRGTGTFSSLVSKGTIVQMGTIPPECSLQLATDVCDAGGVYVEAPVSGSRKPASLSLWSRETTLVSRACCRC